MQKRYVYAGIGVLALAAALALPVLAQPRFQGPGGWSGGMMGGWGMMGGPGAAQTATPVTTIDQAAARAREAVAGYSSVDLTVAEVMEFSNHFYVLVKEKSTGLGALELIVERTGFVHPEPGPNMMWNTKYGHMAGAGYGPGGMMGGGMMGGWGYGPGAQGYGGPRGPAQPANPAAQPVSKERAKQLAAQYLARSAAGATPDEGTAFYGYFTFDVERSGKPIGMLSVNAYTGAVWYHTWHGTFVAEKDF